MLQLIILILALLPIVTLFAPFIYHTFICKEQDLKKKYNTKWAVVTGASSGIGRAITEKLAAQGINVVLVALDDQLLSTFYTSIKSQYPRLQFVKVGVDLSKDGYMDTILSATKDLDISMLFNNAGYVTIGFFADAPLNKQVGHIECNMMAAVKLTHWFVNRIREKNVKRSAIVFTSSPAGQMPTPFSTLYGATKAFVTEFGVSLAGEVYADGIDVMVLHPSPVDTNFYKVESAHKSSTLNLFWKTATSPTVIAETVFATVGRGVLRDQGYFVFVRYFLNVFDYGLFSWVTTICSRFTSEYKALKKKD